jgi:hypothetical protein
MKEYVLVEFIAPPDEFDQLREQIADLKDDFVWIGDKQDPYVVWGHITSEYASVIKLQNSYLSERMRISYIPDELKDKYRK